VTECLENRLNIRFVKLHFKAQMLTDSELPVYKTSMLRGGMGEMLLRLNCIRDRDCANCGFESECIVQRTMYSKFSGDKPAFITSGDSFGYILNCEDFRTVLPAGEELEFSLTLFGKTIVYFNLFLQAYYALGMQGIGKGKARFRISEVRNIQREPILDDDGNIHMARYKVETVAEYVKYRKKQLGLYAGDALNFRFRSPVSLKYQDQFLTKLEMRPMVESVLRRISILDYFEGMELPMPDSKEWELPEIAEQRTGHVEVPRYSARKDEKMVFRGFVGEGQIRNITEPVLSVLLAGEILQIGKNTSFGFGRYVLRKDEGI